MYRACNIALYAGVLSLVLFGTFALVQAGTGDRIPGQYIVVFKDSVQDADALEAELIVRIHGERMDSYRHVLQGFSARFSDAGFSQVVNDPRVAFVSEDHVVGISDTVRTNVRSERDTRPADPREDVSSTPELEAVSQGVQSFPTGINRIGAAGKTNVGAGVNVAVIDTGILGTHPDLMGQVVGGKNCTKASGGYTDQNGHGTHVSGTIAGLNNKVGVVGVSPGVKLWSVRVLDRFGGGTWSSVICGLDFVASMAPSKNGPIQVANLSLGGTGISDNNCGNSNNDALHKAICRVRDAGVTIIVAAGNSGTNAANFIPAAYNDAVITVSALADYNGKSGGGGGASSYGIDDSFASFSNYGSPVDIGAPGVNIYSTWLNNSYATLSGTSMAAPHVAGAAALYLSTNPGASWTTVRNALLSIGEPLGFGHTDPSLKHPEPVLKVDSL